MSRLCILAILVFGATFCCGQDSGPCKRDSRIPGMQTWFANTRAAFGGKYEVPKIRREKILAASRKLTLGMKQSETASLLGLPDFEEIYSTYDAHIGNRPVANPHCGWEWEYYFTKVGDNFANPSDSFVQLAFNSQRKLIWIQPQNVTGIRPKGSPEY